VANVVDEEFHHVGAVVGGEVCFGDAGFCGGFRGRYVGDSTESGDSLGDGVDMIFEVGGDGIEEQMELVKILALDVPVGPFEPGCERRRCREAEIEVTRLEPGDFCRGHDAAWIGTKSCGCGFCHGRTSSSGDWFWG